MTPSSAPRTTSRAKPSTFGYPEVVGVADSLCRLLEHTPKIDRIPLVLVDQHVDAVRAMTRESARADRAEVAGELVRRLREVTDDFLRRENEFRPGLSGKHFRAVARARAAAEVAEAR